MRPAHGNLVRLCFKMKIKSRVWWCMPVIPVFGRLRQEDHRFVASLSILVRPCFKIQNKPGVVAQVYNPSTWEAETGGSQVCGQPPQLSKILFQNKILGLFGVGLWVVFYYCPALSPSWAALNCILRPSRLKDPR